MLQVRETGVFSAWLKSVRDPVAVAKIAVRIDRLALGNPGDVAPVGDGISELRIHHGPGYRVYFAVRGTSLVLLLAGGTKSTQAKDIRRAKSLLK